MSNQLEYDSIKFDVLNIVNSYYLKYISIQNAREIELRIKEYLTNRNTEISKVLLDNLLIRYDSRDMILFKEENLLKSLNKMNIIY